MAKILFSSNDSIDSLDLNNSLPDSPIFGGLNLALHVGDDPINVKENREKVGTITAISKIAFMEQTHGDKFLEITNENWNKNPEVDGIFTKEKNLGLAVLVADCMPILLEFEPYIAAVHAGRRGIEKKILSKVLEQISKLTSSNSFKVWVGPHICKHCYQVSKEIYEYIKKANPNSIYSEFYLDLFGGIEAEISEFARARNLKYEVSALGGCTLENSNLYSYRRNPITGRQIGMIAL